ncbi:hypothetical protein AAVH_18606 [Aphelenchoides avenae]|nr:hypothetical protein AAVH_18606 [Aphelenchus avenae]
MLHEVALEALRYFDRKSLEGLQMHSRYLRDIVNRNSRTLPLRQIKEVRIAGGRVGMDLLRAQPMWVDNWIDVPASSEQDLEKLFHRVNNAFIRVLEFSFCPEDLAPLNYLRTKVGELQCQIRSLRIRASTAEIDYAVVDFLGVHLKPQVYHFSTYRPRFEEASAMLFARNSLRDCVAHLEYNMFETAERGTKIVPSVTLLHQRFGEASPMHHTGEPLGLPRRTDIPTPQSAFIKKWSRTEQLVYGTNATATESTVADFFVFESAKSGKKLEVYLWAVQQLNRNEPRFHYAFLLQVVDM